VRDTGNSWPSSAAPRPSRGTVASGSSGCVDIDVEAEAEAADVSMERLAERDELALCLDVVEDDVSRRVVCSDDVDGRGEGNGEKRPASAHLLLLLAATASTIPIPAHSPLSFHPTAVRLRLGPDSFSHALSIPPSK
jgi:hypothetical protein